jgi:hypothetical protein
LALLTPEALLSGLGDRVQLNGGVGFGVNDQVVGGRVGLRMGW